MVENNEVDKQAQYADRASKGGAARMHKLSRAERSAFASQAAKARWNNKENQQLTEPAGIEVSRADSIPEAR